LNPEFKRVTIIGVGLIGGSLGMALCRSGLAKEVIGAGSRLKNLSVAVEMGAVNRIVSSPEEGAVGADLVVIATPVSATIPVLKKILPYLTPGAVITDVGSTKAAITGQAEKLLPEGISFVGGHPMAGSERAGVRAADPYLFENAFYLITPNAGTPPDALKKVKMLAEGVGAKVVEIEPELHDFAIAAVSHLPHMLAATLVNAVAGMPDSEKFLPLAAGGFRDTTRVAAGNPVMWRDIFVTNRVCMQEVLRFFRAELDYFESLIAGEKEEAVHRKLERAREVRSGLSSRTKGYLPCLYEIVVTVPDRPGIIAGFTSYLAEAGINISDIEILRVREGEGGTVKLAFTAEKERDAAVRILREKKYMVHKK
jgi:prephenate dehydrogenase